MADTVQTQDLASQPKAQTTGTDTNLNLNFDDIKIPEAPATTTDLNIDFSDVQKPETNVQNPEVNAVSTRAITIIQEPAPVATEGSPASTVVEAAPAKDDRLAKEDKIVEAKIEDNGTAQLEKVETVNAPEATTKQEIVVRVENTPAVMETNLPTTSLKEDQKIIDELTSTANTNSTGETVNAPVVEEVKPVVEEAPAPVSMDLDSLLGTPSTPVVNEVIAPAVINPIHQQPVVEIVPQVSAEIIPQSVPGSTFQTVLPPIANPIITPTIQIANTMPTVTADNPLPPKHKKSMKTFLILLALGGVAAYVLATMYPLEYQNMKANVTSLFGGDVAITETTGLENMLEATGQIEEIGQTGGLSTGGLSTLQTGGLLTGDLSTPGFDGFADLQDVLTGSNGNPALTNQQLAQLKKFSDEAKTFIELGKKINDKIMIKYGTYISKKADGFILGIENKEQIDNAKIDGYLAQFSVYLHQLTTLSYNGIDTTTEPTMIPEETDASTSGENDTTSGMIQDINRDNSGSTTSQDSQNSIIPGV